MTTTTTRPTAQYQLVQYAVRPNTSSEPVARNVFTVGSRAHCEDLRTQMIRNEVFCGRPAPTDLEILVWAGPR